MGEEDDGLEKDRSQKEERIQKDRTEKEDPGQVIRDDLDRIDKAIDRLTKIFTTYIEISIKNLALPGQMAEQLPETANESARQLLSTSQKAIEASSWDLPASIQAFQEGDLPELIASRTQELTQVLWEGGEKQYTALSKYWRPAQLHVMNMVKTGIASANSLQDATSIIIQSSQQFDPKVYRDRISDLARYMWQQQGSPLIDPLRYWVSAEKHILAIASRAIRAATSPSDAGRALATAIETFDPREYFELIRREAYAFWGTTPSHGHDIEDWLRAEDALRDRQ